MSNVVRRVAQEMDDGDFLPPIDRQGEGLVVRTQKCLGAQPHLLIEWEADENWWDQGYKLLGFRNGDGFAKDIKPKDLSAHGQLILEETSNGSRRECLPEGTYYYTFLLRKHHWFMPSFTEPVRFSETIPSAKTAISRIEDQMKVVALRDELELRPSLSEIARNETEIKLLRSREALARAKAPKPDDSPEANVRREVEPLVQKAMEHAYTRVELVTAREALLKKIKKHAGFKSLTREQQEQLIDEIAEALDADETGF